MSLCNPFDHESKTWLFVLLLYLGCVCVHASYKKPFRSTAWSRTLRKNKSFFTAKVKVTKRNKGLMSSLFAKGEDQAESKGVNQEDGARGRSTFSGGEERGDGGESLRGEGGDVLEGAAGYDSKDKSLSETEQLVCKSAGKHKFVALNACGRTRRPPPLLTGDAFGPRFLSWWSFPPTLPLLYIRSKG